MERILGNDDQSLGPNDQGGSYHIPRHPRMLPPRPRIFLADDRRGNAHGDEQRGDLVDVPMPAADADNEQCQYRRQDEIHQFMPGSKPFLPLVIGGEISLLTSISCMG